MYYIGIDLGTSALKLLLVDAQGQIHKTVSRSYPVCYPQPAWSEQDPQNWWDAFLSGIPELIEGIDPAMIGGIGAGGQMHGLVALDENDRVIRPAILWNDVRTTKECQEIMATFGDQLLAITKNVALEGFTLPKIRWEELDVGGTVAFSAQI